MAKKSTSGKAEKKKKKQRITGPRSIQNATGFKDRYTEKQWWWFFDLVAYETMQKYNYSELHPSTVDYTVMYNRALGKDSDLSDNLIYLDDDNGEHLSLRPNFEIPYLRAYFLKNENNFETKVLPIENWY